MSSDAWKPLDVQDLLDRRRRQIEQTTSGNVGGFAVPLGAPLRPAVLDVPKKKKKQRG